MLQDGMGSWMTADTVERGTRVRVRPSGDSRPSFRAHPHPSGMRLVVLGLAVLSLGMTGCTGLPFLNAEAQTQALAQDHYIRDVQVAVNTLTFVFEQADVSLKAVTSGWLASEGAATQFAFLHGRVKDVKDTLSATEPPAAYEVFHRQLGRSLSLTQQAMDSMEAGFTSGDGTYFTLAQEKLGEARTTLGRAVHEL